MAAEADKGSTVSVALGPSAEEALEWLGWRLDDLAGSRTGRVECIYRDARQPRGVWLGVRMGRFGHRSALPLAHVAAVDGHVWAPYERDLIRAAPRLAPGRPLTLEDELDLLQAFGLALDQGRGAELASRSPGTETAIPVP